MHTNPTLSAFNNLASLYNDRFKDLELYNQSYDCFCNSINKQKADILEIGCGPGNITKYIHSKRPDIKIKAIDFAPNMISLAQENNPGVLCEVMDCRNISSIQEKFDGIICGFTVPYLNITECRKLIYDCYHLLNNEGVLYLSFIEGDYKNSCYQLSSNGQEKALVHYYTLHDISIILKSERFEKFSNVSRVDYKKSEAKTETHLIILAKK